MAPKISEVLIESFILYRCVLYEQHLRLVAGIQSSLEKVMVGKYMVL